MAVNILFDSENTVITPTLILAKRNGEKIGILPASGIVFSDAFNAYNTVDFKVYKENNGIVTRCWDDITDFKLVWCKEWDAWFQIKVDVTESDDTVKSITGTSIGEAELSAIKLYEIEINTENDIARDDYEPTVLYDPFNPKRSLLNRISGKIPHFSFTHVDPSIINIQRTFTFDNVSMLDAFNQIAEEIGCIFIFKQNSNEDGYPSREIEVYDLEDSCQDCGYRGEDLSICPECGSTNIEKGYGDDTSIFVSSDNLSDEISLTTDTDSVNMCFRLHTGDDIMDATVASCNPNGSRYIWYISDELKEEMSDPLSSKIDNYEEIYSYYQDEYTTDFDATKLSAYNNLVSKYLPYNPDLEQIQNDIGFSTIIDAFYNVIDFRLFLQSGLMPSIEISDTTASDQAAQLTRRALSPIAVSNINVASKATVDSNALSMAKAIVRPTYKVEVVNSSYNTSTHVWQGSFKITNYSDETDTADSSVIEIDVNDDYQTFISQKIKKKMANGDTEDYSITSLFKKDISKSGNTYTGEFVTAIKDYSLNALVSFKDASQTCLDVLIEEGISDKTTWGMVATNGDLYDSFYLPYLYKQKALEAEIAVRESEIAVIDDMKDHVESKRSAIQEELNFESYLGTDLWNEFCLYRRESDYSNSNYISDGLSNSQIIERAKDFLKEANTELIKSATLQHSITSSLRNLLVMKEFKIITSYFKVGNWIRVRIDDKIYKLRLISYEIDFENLENISVEFSDVKQWNDDVSDIESVISQAKSMATTYSGLERQAKQSEETTEVVEDWFTNGLDATLTNIVNRADGQTMTFDSHGMLMRCYDDVSTTYAKEQVKLINSTIAFTDDDWETTKTAIGKFFYYDPVSLELHQAYGINAETIIGRLIIGETLGLYNSGNTLNFNENGLSVTNGTYTFSVNPNLSNLINLSNEDEAIFTIDNGGNLRVKGDITALTLGAGGRTSSATGNEGLYIDSNGNLYSGNNNQTIIYSNGQFSFGSGKLIYNGSALSVDGNIKATTLSTGGKTSSATGNSGTYIDSNGNLYSGANNETIIYANGNVNLGNGKLVYNGSTLSVSGAITATTLSAGGKTSSSANHEGLFIASNGNLVAGANNETVISANGNVNLGNGKLVYNNSTLSVNGAITATSLSSGGKTSSSSASGGTYISSSGSIYVGDSNQTIISSAGKITTKDLLVYGSETEITCTINDSITFKNDLIGTDNILGRFIEKSDTVSGTNIYNTFTIYGDHITFSRTNDGSCSIYYSGNKAFQIDSSVQLDGSLNVDGSISSGGAVAIGSMNNGVASITAGSKNTSIIGVYNSSGNEVLHVGSGNKSTSGINATYLHGEAVRVYSYTSGAVYLGASGSTAITSDETLKDIFTIDDKYATLFDRLNPVAYRYKVGHRTHLGFGAQSVEKAIYESGLSLEDFAGLLIDEDVDIGDDEILSPDGSTHFDKLYSLRYEEFIALNTMMIKRLKEKVESLERQLKIRG